MFNDSDFKKIKQKIDGLSKAKKIAIRFPLKQVCNMTTESGAKNKMNCHYFIEAKGHEVAAKLIASYPDDGVIPITFLKILSSCLKELQVELVAMKMADSEMVKICNDIWLNEKADGDQREKALEIIDTLSDYASTHDSLIKHGLLQSIKTRFQVFQELNPAEMKSPLLRELMRVFAMIKSLAQNLEIADALQESGVLGYVIEVYSKNRDIAFLNDLFIETVFQISKTFEGQEMLKASDLDLRDLVTNALKSKNKKIIDSTQTIVANIMSQEDITQCIAKVLGGDADDQQFNYLAFLSNNPLFSDLLDSSELLNVITSKLQASPSFELQMSLVKLLGNQISASDGMVKMMIDKDVIPQVQKIAIESKNFLLMSEHLDFLIMCLTVSGKSVIPQLYKVAVVSQFRDTFQSLTKDFSNYTRKGMFK